jgi:hypothetical protein
MARLLKGQFAIFYCYFVSGILAHYGFQPSSKSILLCRSLMCFALLCNFLRFRLRYMFYTP